MEAAKRGRGRPRRLRFVEVRCADPSKYAKLGQDPSQPFAKMDAEIRANEMVLFCAHIWAETCREMTRNGKGTDGRAIAA